MPVRGRSSGSHAAAGDTRRSGAADAARAVKKLLRVKRVLTKSVVISSHWLRVLCDDQNLNTERAEDLLDLSVEVLEGPRSQRQSPWLRPTVTLGHPLQHHRLKLLRTSSQGFL